MAHLMGPGLGLSVRRVTEWHRRDERHMTTWTSNEGESMVLVGALSRARHIFEVVSSRVVLARFERRYEAEAFTSAFRIREIRRVDRTVLLLRTIRRIVSMPRMREAA